MVNFKVDHPTRLFILPTTGFRDELSPLFEMQKFDHPARLSQNIVTYCFGNEEGDHHIRLFASKISTFGHV